MDTALCDVEEILESFREKYGKAQVVDDTVWGEAKVESAFTYYPELMNI